MKQHRLGKIGLLTVALVLVVGVMGAGFASWTDEVQITGEVDTGTLDLEVVRYSGTYVWKVPGGDNNETVDWHGWMDEFPGAPAGGIEIASFYMREAGTDEVADVVGVATNIFPYESFVADVLLHYNGSIPAEVWAYETFKTGDLALTDIMGWDYSTVTPRAIFDTATIGDYDPETGVFEPDASIDSDWGPGRINLYNGWQMHYCDYLLLEVIMNIPQDNALQNLSAQWGVDINAIQWNEWTGAPPLP
ncbi:MAG: hypothetical protein JW846_03280 [Dehalococcoidia bacterium]|nr:hypothetical protein [Dehalococcoidia bacterium]